MKKEHEEIQDLIYRIQKKIDRLDMNKINEEAQVIELSKSVDNLEKASTAIEKLIILNLI